MKHTARLITLLLALSLMLTAMACGNSGKTDATEGDVTTTAAPAGEAATTTAPVAETENPYDENGYLKNDLPEDLNFNGETVTVLYWNDVEHPEFESEGITGDIVNDAIYNRNVHVEEKLGVTLGFVHTKGNGSNIAAFKNFVGNAFAAGESEYDLIASYSRTTAACAQAGYCLDLLELDYLNFENPWWPSSLIDIVGIGDSMYFASGDASVNVLHMMYCTLYNKDLITEYNLQDPVELVRSGKWTIEAMKTMSKDLYQDLDNDNKKSAGDFFGTTVGSYHIDALYTGSGLRLVEQAHEVLEGPLCHEGCVVGRIEAVRAVVVAPPRDHEVHLGHVDVVVAPVERPGARRIPLPADAHQAASLQLLEGVVGLEVGDAVAQQQEIPAAAAGEGHAPVPVGPLLSLGTGGDLHTKFHLGPFRLSGQPVRQGTQVLLQEPVLLMQGFPVFLLPLPVCLHGLALFLGPAQLRQEPSLLPAVRLQRQIQMMYRQFLPLPAASPGRAAVAGTGSGLVQKGLLVHRGR